MKRDESRSEENTKLREKIDNDNFLQVKRKSLIIVSIVFLSLNLSGATLEEANTFIFKIRFENSFGISTIFIISIIFLSIRYYGYAKPYHKKLFKAWSSNVIHDEKSLVISRGGESTTGILSKLIPSVYEDNIDNIKYNRKLFFNRFITYDQDVFNEENKEYERATFEINLNKYTKNWSKSDYYKILCIEIKHQIFAYIGDREQLDILAPYLIGSLAILTFFIKPF